MNIEVSVYISATYVNNEMFLTKVKLKTNTYEHSQSQLHRRRNK